MAKIEFLIGIAKFGQHLIAYINGWRGKNDACIGRAVENELEILGRGYAFDGVVNFVLNGLD